MKLFDTVLNLVDSEEGGGHYFGQPGQKVDNTERSSHFEIQIDWTNQFQKKRVVVL